MLRAVLLTGHHAGRRGRSLAAGTRLAGIWLWQPSSMGGQLCPSPRRSMPGWPGYALPSTPGSKKSASALASWCWLGRPPSSAAPQRPRSSRHRAGHRPRCTGRWPARRGRLCRPCRCARGSLLRGQPNCAVPRLQHPAPARLAGPATSITPPPTSPPAVRAPAGCGTGASGHLGTGITSPGVAGGTTAIARGSATAAGPTVIAAGITVAGRTISAGIAPVTAIGKGDQAKKITGCPRTRVLCGARGSSQTSRVPRRTLLRRAGSVLPMCAHVTKVHTSTVSIR